MTEKEEKIIKRAGHNRIAKEFNAIPFRGTIPEADYLGTCFKGKLTKEESKVQVEFFQDTDTKKVIIAHFWNRHPSGEEESIEHSYIADPEILPRVKEKMEEWNFDCNRQDQYEDYRIDPNRSKRKFFQLHFGD